ncbi:unnamed protein product [Rotaria sp. Silwood1]|nr:unnamed protein product [Rotaria sp. Silwood1]
MNDNFLRLLQSILQTLYATVGLVLFIIDTIGNLFNVILFSRLESLNKLPSSLFLLASFIGSQIMLITGLVPRVIVGLTGNTSLVNFLLLCKVRTMLKPASATFSMACVCLAAFDRYLYSSLDLRCQRWVTLQQTRLIITITVILCLVVFSPYAVLFYTAPVPSSCSIVNPIFIYVQPCLSLIFYNLAPVVILSIICSLIWRNLGQQVAFYLRGHIRCYDQVTPLIIAQMIVILATTFPTVIWLIYTITTQNVSKSSLLHAQEAIVSTVFVLPAYCPYSIMFYVYLIVSPVFRRNVKCLVLGKRRILPEINTQRIRKSNIALELRM